MRATDDGHEDAEALYRAAAEESRAGRKARAAELLRRAAAADHAGAHHTLASMLLHGAAGEIDRPAAFRHLCAAAGLGLAGSAELVALFEAAGIGTAPSWSAAIQRLLASARSGSPAATRQLGMLALMTRDGRDAGTSTLLIAAAAGDLPAALALARLMADGEAVPLDPVRARAAASAARAAGHPVAAELLGALPEANGPPPPVNLPGLQPERLADLLAEPPVPPCPAAERLCESPEILRLDGFLSRVECDYAIGKAAPLLAPSRVADESGGGWRPDPWRTSLTASIYPLDRDLVLHALDLRIAAASGFPPAHGEMLSVLAYAPGQEYRPHFDAFDETSTVCARELRQSGQRAATFLVALADRFEGGETVFPRLGLSFRGRAGDALVFRNLDDAGRREPRALHAGLPVRSGVKWLASKWLRERPFVW